MSDKRMSDKGDEELAAEILKSQTKILKSQTKIAQYQLKLANEEETLAKLSEERVRRGGLKAHAKLGQIYNTPPPDDAQRHFFQTLYKCQGDDDFKALGLDAAKFWLLNRGCLPDDADIQKVFDEEEKLKRTESEKHSSAPSVPEVNNSDMAKQDEVETIQKHIEKAQEKSKTVESSRVPEVKGKEMAKQDEGETAKKHTEKLQDKNKKSVTSKSVSEVKDNKCRLLDRGCNPDADDFQEVFDKEVKLKESEKSSSVRDLEKEKSDTITVEKNSDEPSLKKAHGNHISSLLRRTLYPQSDSHGRKCTAATSVLPGQEKLPRASTSRKIKYTL